MRVLLVRHGVTDFNDTGRVTGRGGADPELNRTGVHQAACTAAAVAALVSRLPRLSRRDEADSPVVVHSALRRAAQTAAPIAEALGAATVVDAGWDEQAAGEWDGLTWKQIARRNPGASGLARTDSGYRPPGGESFADMDARVWRAWHHAVALASTVVIVTHRGPVDVLLTRLIGLDRPRAAQFRIDNCSLTLLHHWRDGGLSVEYVNDTAHLECDTRTSSSTQTP